MSRARLSMRIVTRSGDVFGIARARARAKEVFEATKDQEGPSNQRLRLHCNQDSIRGTSKEKKRMISDVVVTEMQGAQVTASGACSSRTPLG